MKLPPAITRVLAVFRKHEVKALLMGGQACIVYGGAEFSRDIDFAVLSEENNLNALSAAMHELQATTIAVPPFSRTALEDGLAVHFRCRAPEVEGLRVDVMSVMRGVPPFPELWNRRFVLPDGAAVMSLPDLVLAKKTQRDKDWPMIRRLLEADILTHPQPTPDQLNFWLRECRTPALLFDLASRFPDAAASHSRPAVRAAATRETETRIHSLLREEEDAERAADAAWWAPLKRQLEQLRRADRWNDNDAGRRDDQP